MLIFETSKFRKMKKLFTLCYVLITQLVVAQIPTANVTNWKIAKHEGAYPKNVTHVSIATFGGVGNGVTNTNAALSAAIASLNGKAGIIDFGAGDYLFNSNISLSDSIILRGAGANSTTFTFNFNNVAGNCITMSGVTQGSWISVTAGINKNSKGIKPVTTAGFTVGDFIELRQLNGAWNTNPAAWAEYSVGQILRIDSIKSGKLFFHEKLRIAYDTALSVQVARLKPIKNAAVECLKIRRTDGAATSVNFGIFMNKAFNCWVNGVAIEKMIGAHICISTSTRCEVTGSYFYDAYAFDGVSTHGYGVLLNSHACENKVENNIFRKLRHAVTCKEGANGNVIAYNYTLEPTRSEFPSDAGADLLLHGHYAFANLFEGNICNTMQMDQTWGPNGPWNTFYRNRMDGYGLIVTSGTVPTDNENFVGNDITATTLFKGNYSLTGSNHFQYGNRVKGTITPSGTNVLTTLSYYLTKAPIWWTSSVAWPCVGLPYNLATATNPARDRYLSGSNFTVCATKVARFADEEVATITAYPNPTSGMVYLTNLEQFNQYEVAVYDVFGRLVSSVANADMIYLKDEKSGIYFFVITADGLVFKEQVVFTR